MKQTDTVDEVPLGNLAISTSGYTKLQKHVVDDMLWPRSSSDNRYTSDNNWGSSTRYPSSAGGGYQVKLSAEFFTNPVPYTINTYFSNKAKQLDSKIPELRWDTPEKIDVRFNEFVEKVRKYNHLGTKDENELAIVNVIEEITLLKDMIFILYEERVYIPHEKISAGWGAGGWYAPVSGATKQSIRESIRNIFNFLGRNTNNSLWIFRIFFYIGYKDIKPPVQSSLGFSQFPSRPSTSMSATEAAELTSATELEKIAKGVRDSWGDYV